VASIVSGFTEQLEEYDPHILETKKNLAGLLNDMDKKEEARWLREVGARGHGPHSVCMSGV